MNDGYLFHTMKADNISFGVFQLKIAVAVELKQMCLYTSLLYKHYY